MAALLRGLELVRTGSYASPGLRPRAARGVAARVFVRPVLRLHPRDCAEPGRGLFSRGHRPLPGVFPGGIAVALATAAGQASPTHGPAVGDRSRDRGLGRASQPDLGACARKGIDPRARDYPGAGWVAGAGTAHAILRTRPLSRDRLLAGEVW